MKRDPLEKRAHAKRLYLAGAPLKEIAKKSSSKVDTVESWVRRYGWRQEREALRQAALAEQCPSLVDADTVRLETATAIYAAMTEERSELMKRWSSSRNRNREDAESLNYTGKYDLPDSYERAQFCSDLKAISEAIECARREIETIRSQSTGAAAPPPAPVETDGSEQNEGNVSYLRSVQSA